MRRDAVRKQARQVGPGAVTSARDHQRRHQGEQRGREARSRRERCSDSRSVRPAAVSEREPCPKRPVGTWRGHRVGALCVPNRDDRDNAVLARLRRRLRSARHRLPWWRRRRLREDRPRRRRRVLRRRIASGGRRPVSRRGRGARFGAVSGVGAGTVGVGTVTGGGSSARADRGARTGRSAASRAAAKRSARLPWCLVAVIGEP